MRHAMNPGFRGQFGTTEVTIRNLSSNGFMILHTERVLLGAERLLRFVYPPSFDRESHRLRIPQRQPDLHCAEFQCVAVWSRLGRDPAIPGPAYRTGLNVVSGNPQAGLLPLVLHEFVRPEGGELARKRNLVLERAQRAQELADVLLLARTASEYLRTHPAVAYQWHRRARYALSCRNVPHADNPALGLTPEVVAVWEFLGRTIPLLTVAHAVGGGEWDGDAARSPNPSE